MSAFIEDERAQSKHYYEVYNVLEIEKHMAIPSGS